MLRWILLIGFIIFFNTIVWGQNNNADSIFKNAEYFLIRSNPDNAIPELFKIIETYNSYPDIVDRAHISLAEAYREKQEYEKGIELITGTLKNPQISLRNKAFAWNRLAAIYNESRFTQNTYIDSTIKYSNLCINLSEEEGFLDLLALSQNEMGYVYRTKKEYALSLNYYRSAYANFMLAKLIPNTLNVSYNLAGVYLDLNMPDRALEIIDSAIVLSDENEYPNIYMRLYLRKSDIYEFIHDFNSAFFYQKKARQLQEKFYGDRIQLQINEMSAKYDLQTKEQMLREREHENEIRRQQNRYLIFFSAILIIAIIVILINFSLRRKIRKRKEQIIKNENENLRKSLSFKEKEIEYKTLELSKAASNLISFNEILRNIDTANKKNNSSEIHEIISSNVSFDHNWQTFKLHFEELYPSFFHNLNKKYPSLSDTDIKICAFLLIGMKSIEIANIMIISDASVAKYRNRLRKKIGIEAGADIGEHLKSIA
ncbi:MAG: hypothetical protein JXR53_03620 [Bacteroidales bacterium]|nr:hypothetical protein [Bacteroidales bacterium]